MIESFSLKLLNILKINNRFDRLPELIQCKYLTNCIFLQVLLRNLRVNEGRKDAPSRYNIEHNLCLLKKVDCV